MQRERPPGTRGEGRHVGVGGEVELGQRRVHLVGDILATGLARPPPVDERVLVPVIGRGRSDRAPLSHCRSFSLQGLNSVGKVSELVVQRGDLVLGALTVLLDLPLLHVHFFPQPAHHIRHGHPGVLHDFCLLLRKQPLECLHADMSFLWAHPWLLRGGVSVMQQSWRAGKMGGARAKILELERHLSLEPVVWRPRVSLVLIYTVL